MQGITMKPRRLMLVMRINYPPPPNYAHSVESRVVGNVSGTSAVTNGQKKMYQEKSVCLIIKKGVIKPCGYRFN